MYRLRGYCNCGRVIEDVSVRDMYEGVCMSVYICMHTYVYHCVYDGIQDAGHRRRRETGLFRSLRHVTCMSLSIVIELTTVSFEMQCAMTSENCGQSQTVYDDGLPSPNSLIENILDSSLRKYSMLLNRSRDQIAQM